MNCPNCNHPIPEGAVFCTECGATISAPAYSAPAQPAPAPIMPEPPVPPAPAYVPPVQPAPVYHEPVAPAPAVNNAKPTIPPEYKPLTAWQYFGLQILFAIPVVGFVFLIVFSFNSSNLNRRSFARSYWCALFIAVGAALLALIIGMVAGVSLLDAF